VRFLVDGRDYYAALRAALTAARCSIHLLGWGFDPRIDLPADAGDDLPQAIGHLLTRLARDRPQLDIRLLVWRSALPIAATQAFFPHRARGWFRGTGVDFRLDSDVPFGACHHQKIIVIDGALAFVGGADLMPGRWDTPAHPDRDRRRGRGGPPRHEAMALVDGPAAAAFEALFLARWRRSQDEMLVLPPGDQDPWPEDLAPDLANVEVAIARTLPAWRGEDGVREIAGLSLEAIAAAERLIYLEGQYFTWPLATEALAARLAEPDGPEVVLILSEKSPSYFDRITMDRARAKALWRLRAGDVFGRFHALSPFAAGGRPIVVHAKLMIIDDRLARIGSANLNNRSHGFDTEVELVVEATDQAERAAIARLRNWLASHWVGCSAEALASAQGDGPLARALLGLDPGGRLRPAPARDLGAVGEFIADFHLGDPSEVSDAWRLGLRRTKLLAESRTLREAIVTVRD
jgi:phosphatidylserine/phosphatidylglycerophosphate/cardiolipin synthase-like enzyme